ncbi:Holliday junction resolvase RecU [Bacillus thuringiensis]|uniref:Holliday junction resolvase RecU n=1 Tax=Bacillus thuringiensis serovar andalousiensis TaxID=257985 RepID=A0A6H0TMN2_BACTU|nr:Holliday junction resolvase RecU [Bacillus thuringiensis]QIW21210.1 Holliday junction resolvase RecU [Bacillus thuringiensis serovar andalousiensis]
MGYGNRGMAFELLLNNTCRMYKSANIAVFNKRPTPIKVIKTDKKSNITKSAWGSKSTVDYDGVYKGRAVYFEAKSTMETTRFPLDNISRHQIDYLKDTQDQGAICFFLIEFRTDHVIYFVPVSLVAEYYEAMLYDAGRKSIPRDEFNKRAYIVEQTDRAPVDYLLHVDKLEWPLCS